MRVLVVGPIFPYRGGISHSNRLLCENLGKTNDLTAISFSRMYPRLLYPGREQKEAGSDSGFTVPTEHVLDSMNPLTWIELARRIRREKPDRVIFHWWHAFFAPMFWTIVRLGRNDKTRYGVVTHNVYPHEKSGIQERLTRIFFRSVDYFATLCSPDLDIVRRIVPGKPSRWFTETTTESQFAPLPDRDTARKQLGLAAESILFFGFVRPYKGLEFLLKALPAVLEHVPRLTLMIVGEFWKDRQLYTDLVDELGMAAHVRIVDRYVSGEEAPTFFAAADAVVLPYVSSTASGIIQLAYGWNLPVITTAVGGNVDLITHGKTGLLCRPEDPVDLARVIIEFYEKEMGAPLRAGMKAHADIFRWTAEKERTVLGD